MVVFGTADARRDCGARGGACGGAWEGGGAQGRRRIFLLKCQKSMLCAVANCVQHFSLFIFSLQKPAIEKVKSKNK